MQNAMALVLVAACGSTATTAGIPESSLDPDPVDHPAVPPGFVLPEPLLGLPLYVRDVDGVPWFADEQLDAAKIIALWARGVGFTVDDPATTRELFARAERGQDVTTGKTCGSPLWRLPAAERWRVELHAQGRIEVSIACVATCTLSVRISEGIDAAASDAGRTAVWSAPFDRARPWRDELAQKLWDVTGAPRDPQAGPPAASTEERLPEAILAAPRACLGDVGAIGVVVQANEAGTITRCEGFARTIVGNGPIAACACKALVGAQLGGGARRASATVTLPAVPIARTAAGKPLEAFVTAARKRDAQPIVSDRSVRAWEPPSPWTIAACFAGAADASLPLQAKAVITVGGAKGRVTRVVLTDLVGAMTPSQMTCVAAAVKKFAKVPCPAAGEHTLDANLTVRVP